MVFSVVFMLFVSLLLTLPGYFLSCIGLYSIAARRGIDRPWLAWVPGMNLYLLGCISDQYQAMVPGKNKNKRTVLLLLLLGSMVLYCVLLLMPLKVETGEILPFLLMGIALLGIVGTECVIGYLALYDVYRSCDPKNAVLFLILSIVLSVTAPFFLFFCRNKDLGFPL